ncbi:hypothetical protein EVAR_38492_1 [Eumeta japonica]|uniref:Uncharacterized protein n=1 Tax=Eumeta variegata TaxID=151549 RepID=A0A4C1WQF2_EUMVA|nr:hypothetical protein EVAR_38492_1 [Eumeta japonica]
MGRRTFFMTCADAASVCERQMLVDAGSNDAFCMVDPEYLRGSDDGAGSLVLEFVNLTMFPRLFGLAELFRETFQS